MNVDGSGLCSLDTTVECYRIPQQNQEVGHAMNVERLHLIRRAALDAMTRSNVVPDINALAQCLSQLASEPSE
jgi:hypothetical protein